MTFGMIEALSCILRNQARYNKITQLQEDKTWISHKKSQLSLDRGEGGTLLQLLVKAGPHVSQGLISMC